MIPLLSRNPQTGNIHNRENVGEKERRKLNKITTCQIVKQKEHGEHQLLAAAKTTTTTTTLDVVAKSHNPSSLPTYRRRSFFIM